LPATTKIELNTATEGESPTWQLLEHLSTGQKATAVLLLLESEAPLVVDQPEDDLDNRFITEGVVPIMRDERRRQFVFSTRNTDIPVLGDAELILGLGAEGEGREGHAMILPKYMGSIDGQPVRELVDEIWRTVKPPSKCVGLNTASRGHSDNAHRIIRTDQQQRNSGVEFKRDVIDNRALAKELVGFSNPSGGVVLLGVEDDGSVSGITRDRQMGAPLKFCPAISFNAGARCLAVIDSIAE
jgi:hypothetical protein